MEALSPTMEEGKLVKWLKNEGDAVKTGDPIAEVETDKAIMELVARGDGVLRKRVVNEGDAVPVGTLVGIIATADENIDALVGGAAAPAPAAAPATAPGTPQQSTGPSKNDAAAVTNAAPPAAAPAVPAPTAVPAAPAAAAPTGPTRSSPLARRMATEKGVELSTIQGSGPNGRIIKRDVEGVAAGAPVSAAAPQPTGPSSAASARQPVASEGTSPNRVGWSRKTLRSARQSPPSASITAKSRSVRPGSCRELRLRTPVIASESAPVRPTRSARPTSKAVPAREVKQSASATICTLSTNSERFTRMVILLSRGTRP
jgi:pyruvate dehydrogenase E2 component (dihydrolipoamide acetyltransferase)